MTKACFADPDYFNETSRGCVRCEYFKSCQARVNESVSAVSRQNNVGWRTVGVAPTASATPATNVVRRVIPGTAPTTSPGQPLGVVRGIARESNYNFDTPIMPQLMRFVGFSVAEVCLEELLTLVQQGRQDYVSRNTYVAPPLPPESK